MTEGEQSQRRKVRRVGRAMAWTLLGILVALAIVAIINGLNLSSGMTYGDLLVGVGTLALAAYTATLAIETYAIDERADKREAARTRREDEIRRRETQNVATLLQAELELSNETLQPIYVEGIWRRGALLPRTAWDRHPEPLLRALRPDETLALVRYFEKLDGWTRTVAAFLNDPHNAGHSHMNVEQAKNDLGGVGELVPLWDEAMTIARFLASGGRKDG